MRPRRRPKPVRREPVGQDKKNLMLAICVRNYSAYDQLKTTFQGDFMQTVMTVPQQLVWRACYDYVEKNPQMPTYSILNADVYQMVNSKSASFEEEELDEIDQLVDYIFDERIHNEEWITDSPAAVQYAITVATQLVEEEAVTKGVETLVAGNTIPVDLPAILKKMQLRVEEAQTLVGVALPRVFEEGWDAEERIQIRPTGISFIDHSTDGGLAGGETMVFMGPYGSCKTTLSVQMLSNYAKWAAQASMQGVYEGKRLVSVLISTEMGLREFRNRLLAYIARIPLNRIMKVPTLDSFCKARHPGAIPETSYELTEFSRDIPEAFQCEFDRVTLATRLVNEHMLFVNCSPSNKDMPNLGAGGIPEVARILASQIRKEPNIKPMFISLDHASALVDRMIIANDMDDDDKRGILKRLPLQVRDQLAAVYDCPVLIIHQLNGEANAKTSSVISLNHAYAADCKSFCEYADWAGVVGIPTQDARQLTQFRMTKHRRQPPRNEAIVQIDGAYCRVLDASEKYMLSDDSHDFTERAVAETFEVANRS